LFNKGVIMFTLTDAQSKAINTANYTHNYEAEALASFEATGDDLMEELEERFETSFTDYDLREDLGGVTVYLKDNKLVAFYDYEQFKGAVFN
jgi:hypothetical protein